MKITVENTTRIVEVNGVACRLWEGTSERGVRVECLIVRIAARSGEDLAEFERDLQEQQPPRSAEAFPLRMIL